MDKKESQKLKRTVFAALFWALLAVILVGGSTFAWFTFTTSNHVTPLAGTIGTGGAELLISDSRDGVFSESCDLPLEGDLENMQLVSTSDLKSWFSSTAHNTAGISNKFLDVTEQIDERSLYGSVFLTTEGGACDVYLDENEFRLAGDPQMLASCRLGLIITTENEGEQIYIFSLDSFGSDGAEAKATMEENNVVIDFVDESGKAILVSDPAESPETYYAKISGETHIEPGQQKLFHLEKGEIAEVNYRIYMEGCDENSFNVVQGKEISLQLGFAGIGN